MKKQAKIYYSGFVQGVGFRFTAEHIARDLGLAGWVKNLSDGRVEVAAEGDEAVIDNFIERIKKDMGHYIKGADINWQDPAGKLKTFEIRF
ncbi:MAG: acylphosphatase [Candidatus Omnitrophica bacterium]|nr:acylphosphatase [Candidatus Omnitrophota bacterium]